MQAEECKGIADRSLMSENTINRHLQWQRRRSDRAETLRHRRDNLVRLERRLPVPLLEATAEHLDTWQSGLKVCPSSIGTYTSHVRAFYLWAYDCGLRADNPAESLPMPKLPRRYPRPIPEKDLTTAFTCATGDLVVWLALAGWCGLRAAEIALLTAERVIDEGDGMYLRVDGKGGKERIVPVPTDVAPLVRQYIRRGPLFYRPKGGVATGGYISKVSSDFFQGVGLPYTLHTLRHRFGTQHYKLTRDIRATGDLMGHVSTSTTALYVAIAQGTTAKGVERLGKTLPKRSCRSGLADLKKGAGRGQPRTH